MHVGALHVAHILAAEKSKVPFFIAGGVLASWAVILSIGFGLRRPKFPGGLAGQRIVIAISIVLVLGATSTAVITAGGSEEKASASAAKEAPASAPAQPSAPAAPSTSQQPPAGATSTPAPAPAKSAPAATTALKLAASGTAIAYDTKQLSAKAGTVTITFSNPSPLEHDVVVAQGSTDLGSTPKFTNGSKTLTLTLKAGTYTFYCSVPGHRQAGMEGTLTVS
jgi:plastocyanin